MRLVEKILLTGVSSPLAEGVEYQRLYGLFSGVNEATIRSAVKRLTDEGCLAKVQSNQEWYISVTGKGEGVLGEKYPVLGVADTVWDSKYTIVVYMVAEKERVARDMWRRYLVKSGFKRLKKGVYVCYIDKVGELTDRLEETDWGRCVAGSVMVFRAELANISAEELAERMYGLSELYSQYLLFVSQAEGVLRMWEGQKGRVDVAKVRGELMEKYFELVEADPGLPIECYSENWLYTQATGLFGRLLGVEV